MQIFEEKHEWPLGSEHREQLPDCPEVLLETGALVGVPGKAGDEIGDARPVRHPLEQSTDPDSQVVADGRGQHLA